MEHLRYRGGWISGVELEHCADTWGAKPSIISRRARELEHDDGLIERRIINGFVQYRALPRQFISASEANSFIKTLGE